MKRTLHSITLLLAIALLVPSCVSKKKFDEMMSDKRGLQQEVSKLKKALRDCDEMRKEKEALESEHEELKGAYAMKQQLADNLEGDIKELTKKYDDLVKRNEDILTSSSEEIKLLAQQLGEKEAQMDAKERELEKLAGELDMLAEKLAQQQADLDKLNEELSIREAKITDLNDQLGAQQRSLTQLKDKLTNALLGFSDADLSVTQKDGKIYVSLSQNLLFGKDSYVIDAAGRDAITKVAGVLNAQDDVSVLVEGHTDSDGSADHNWDLSVKRATAVVKLLTKSGLSPERVTAAGRAYFAPIAENDTEANKSKNRRTEIILIPDLAEIFKLIESAR